MATYCKNMKNIIIITVLVITASLSIFAQKSPPMVDYKGHIMNGKNQIGSITSTGGFDQAGKSMTKVDGKGNIVNSEGKIIGIAPKNGSFVYYFKDNQEKYTIGKANHTGMCKVTNAKGETVMLLHNNYKQQAACAVHCLYENHCMPESDMNKTDHKH